MHKIRGAHFLTAFLMVVLLPVFLLADEIPIYQKYEGPIQPGVVITKENWDTYLPELQKLVSPTRLKWFSMGVKGGYITIPIVKTTYVPLSVGQLEATRKYGGTSRVGADYQLHDWKAGVPFPEPRNGLELYWNVNPVIARSNAHDDLRFYGWFGLFQGSKYQKHFTWDLYETKLRGRTDIPPLGDLPGFKERGVCYKEALVILEPNEVRGFIQLKNRYWDIDKADDSFAYIPAIRRMRRMTGTDFTDPLLGSDIVPDDFETMRQKLHSKMKFRILEYKDMLTARTYTKEMPPDYDHNKYGPFYQVNWEIRPLYQLEIIMNDPNYAYSKRILYIDGVPLNKGGSFLLYGGDTYDQKGRLWKGSDHAAFYADPGLKERLRSFIRHWVINYQTDHITVMHTPPGYTAKNFDKFYPVDQEEAFSIKSLLKRAR